MEARPGKNKIKFLILREELSGEAGQGPQKKKILYWTAWKDAGACNFWRRGRISNKIISLILRENSSGQAAREPQRNNMLRWIA